MPNNLNAADAIAQMTPDQQAAMVSFFLDRWSTAAQGDDLGDDCDRLDIDRDALAQAAGQINNSWNGKS